MTGRTTGPAGVRVFEALTAREVLDRVDKVFQDLLEKIMGLPEFNHNVTFPELDFRVKVSLTTWPLEDVEFEVSAGQHVVGVGPMDVPIAHAEVPIERELEEGFATGAEESVTREDGSVRINAAPDEIRDQIGSEKPVLQVSKSGELVTHVDSESMGGEPVDRVSGPDIPQRDPRRSSLMEESNPPVNPYTGRPGRGIRTDRGGPAIVKPLVGE